MMRSERSPSNRLLREDFAESMAEKSGDAAEPPTKKRRVFLQTMGQQLREVGLLRDSPGETAATFAGSPGDASHITSLNDSPGVDRPSARQVQIQTPESDAVPGEDDQLPTGATMSAARNLWQPVEVLVMPVTDGSDSFTFDDLLDWTRSYFDNWHPAYPFLHAPSILEYFERIVQHGLSNIADSSPYQLTILRSIISISLADCRQTGKAMRPVPSQLAFTSFNDAIQSIQRVLTDESSVLSLQAVVSVQLLLISMLRYNAASRLEGLTVRMAFHLGLHRCPMQFSAFPKKEAELRQRLFWSIYCIDCYICIRLGVPLAIRDADIDVCFPTAERHGDVAHDRSYGDDRLDLLGFLARHAEIRGLITELRNKSVSYRQTEIDEAVVIDAELSKWWNEVDEYLESNSSSSLPISRYHQVTLVVLRHEAIIALNKHTLATSKKTSAYDAALQNCIGASRSIISTLYKALNAGINADLSRVEEVPETTGLLWPSFTWAVWMSAFIMIYAANEDQVPQDVAIRLADRALEVLKHLTLRGSIWPNACAVAIRDLRTQLIDRRNRSKHTHHNGRKSKGVQCGDVVQTRSGATPPQSNNNDNGPRPAPNTSTRLQHSQSSRNETAPSRSSHRIPHWRHDTGSSHDTSAAQENHEPSSSHGEPPASFSGASQPFIARQNWMFSGLAPTFGDSEGNGYAYRMGMQLAPELQMPNYEGAEFFYGLDTPFWASNDQWREMGGNNQG